MRLTSLLLVILCISSQVVSQQPKSLELPAFSEYVAGHLNSEQAQMRDYFATLRDLMHSYRRTNPLTNPEVYQHLSSQISELKHKAEDLFTGSSSARSMTKDRFMGSKWMTLAAESEELQAKNERILKEAREAEQSKVPTPADIEKQKLIDRARKQFLDGVGDALFEEAQKLRQQYEPIDKQVIQALKVRDTPKADQLQFKLAELTQKAHDLEKQAEFQRNNAQKKYEQYLAENLPKIK